MTCWLCGFQTTELATNPKVLTCKNGPCRICLSVTDINEEINQVVATLRQLLAKRCDLRSEQNRVHGTLIRRLPTELKSYIFEYLVPPRTEWGEPLPSRQNLGRIVEKSVIPYTSVCRDWRDTAWSNPQLWSTIHILLGKEVSSSSSINPVHDWILRSGTLPLTLHIVHEGKNLEDESKGVIDAITQCSSRWHSLSFNMTPELLNAFHHSNVQCHLLRCLRIHGLGRRDLLPPLSNPTMSPETIEIHAVPFQSLQISWNQLSSATISGVEVVDLVQLFQHASQMTYCHISFPYGDENFTPPITHHRLKKLSIYYARQIETFLGSLTLPCLQEFYTDDFLHLKYISPLVHRSSYPLARITFNLATGRNDDWGLFAGLRPFPGVTDLVLEKVKDFNHSVTVEKLLLEGYFPDLRYLTLRLEVFHFLWDVGVISRLLDRNRPDVDTATKGIHFKMVVVYQRGASDVMKWHKIIGEQLKALQLDICWREDGR